MKKPSGSIAQMNYGEMLYPLDHPSMKEFSDSLDAVYTLAAEDSGFIWRIPDDQLERELIENGCDRLTSATVSVWDSYESLKRFTYQGLHGEFLKRSSEWFRKIEGPQLVIWPVDIAEQPSFRVALERLQHLKSHGNTVRAFGWID